MYITNYLELKTVAFYSILFYWVESLTQIKKVSSY